jgi:hypothetical protein
MVIQKGDMTIILPRRIEAILDNFHYLNLFAKCEIPKYMYVLCTQPLANRCHIISKETRQRIQATGKWYDLLDTLERT